MTNPKKTFEELGLEREIIENIMKLGYTEPTPIQEVTIPKILQGINLVGQSETGSGKTAAFALPILQKCIKKPHSSQVLILSPTRELSIQIAKACESFSHNLKVAALYGGVGYTDQIRNIRQGSEILVGTPGRVMDLMRSNYLDISKVEYFVLDEADNMLSLGFVEDMRWIMQYVPSSSQKIMFSATLNSEINKIIDDLFESPEIVSIKGATKTAKNIKQFFIVSQPYEEAKLKILESIFETQKPLSTVVFVPTKIVTSTVSEYLNSLGMKIAALHGDIDQKQRERILSLFRNQKIQVIVATDVIARGLDIDHVTHVINYGLPKDSDCYIHRVGRTGRVGREGCAITIITPRELGALKGYERMTKQLMTELSPPTSQDIYESRLMFYLEKIKDVIAKEDLNVFDDICNKLKAEISEITLLKSLIFLVQKDKPLFVKLFEAPAKRYENSTGFSRKETRPSSRTASRNIERNDRESGKYSYRLEIGQLDGINTGTIFAHAIKHFGLEKSNIGKIKIFDKFTLLYLNTKINYLKDLRIQGKLVEVSMQ